MTSVLLTEKQAAARLNLSHRSLQRWRVEGRGPAFVKIGGRAVRYIESVIDDFIEAGARTSTSSRGNAAA